jgi:hypothetical protein
MATVTKLYTSGNVLQSPADVYLGIVPPSSHVPPTQADEIAIDVDGQPATQSAALSSVSSTTPINVVFPNLVGYTPKTGDVVTVSGVTGETEANGGFTLTNVAVGGSTTAADLLGSAHTSAYGGTGGTIKWGEHLGLTEGPTQFSITQTAVEIRADQYEAAIDAAITKMEAEIDIVMEEFDARRLQRFFTNDYGTNPQQLANVDVFQMGGQDSCNDTIRSLMLVSADRGNLGKFLYVYAFRCYLKSSIQVTFHRTAHSTYKLKLGLLADMTRLAGDELLHFVRLR